MALQQTQNSKRRLSLTLLGVTLLLGGLLGLLMNRTYRQLQIESYFQLRAEGERLLALIEEQADTVLNKEEQRAFDEYSYFSVSTKRGLKTKQVLEYSPLSRLPEELSLPGLLGYFQLDPQGEFSTPLLPLSSTPERRRLQTQNLRAFNERQQIEEKLRTKLKTNLISQLGSSSLNEQYVDLNREKSFGSQKSLSSLPLNTDYLEQGESQQTMQNSLFRYQRGKSKAARIPRQEQGYLTQQQEGSPLYPYDQFSSSTLNLTRESLQDTTREKEQVKVDVWGFDSEIDPFKFQMLEDNVGAFIRRVWQNDRRFSQGFLVDSKTFLKSLVEERFRASGIGSFASLIIGYNGEVLETLAPADSKRAYPMTKTSDKPILLVRTHLPAPLENVELLLTTKWLPRNSGAYIVDLLCGVMLVVLLFGMWMVYRLANAHIQVAEQQANFVSAVSHELKTPLTSIRMYSEMLRDDWVPDDEKRKSYYDYIFFESERLSRLVGNVLQLAKLSRNALTLELSEYTPSALLDLARSKVSSVAERSGFALSIENELPDKGLSISIDEDAFCRVMINVVDNAVKFSKDADKKQVDIRLKRDPLKSGFAVLSVRDYGPGIERGQLKRIFQLFYRAENELTRSTPGTGIGLALVKELMTRMGGSLDASNHSPGAELILRLPLKTSNN